MWGREEEKKRNLLKAPDNFRPPSQKQKKFDPLQKKKDFTELSEEKKAKRVYFITVKVGRQKLWSPSLITTCAIRIYGRRILYPFSAESNLNLWIYFSTQREKKKARKNVISTYPLFLTRCLVWKVFEKLRLPFDKSRMLTCRQYHLTPSPIHHYLFRRIEENGQNVDDLRKISTT